MLIQQASSLKASKLTKLVGSPSSFCQNQGKALAMIRLPLAAIVLPALFF